ncbi:hypothetical protein CHCC14814_3812 [Bacillus paralicheniformis]|nr:hypothetical protein CHCC14814_3812 [Bacillus paralicheniformis]
MSNEKNSRRLKAHCYFSSFFQQLQHSIEADKMVDFFYSALSALFP